MTSPHLALHTQADAGTFRAGLSPAGLPPYRAAAAEEWLC